MKEKTAKFIIHFFVVFLLFFTVNVHEVKAEENYNEIYSFEKDGFWRPTDDIGHDFYIDNIWGEECYLEGITFERVNIKDVATDEVYSEDKAISSGIMDDKYYVSISQGEKVIYSGKMSELMKKNYIELEEPIFLNLDTKVKFSMSIYFDALAGNEYQNKKYEYILYPKAFKHIEEFKPDVDLPNTGAVISSSVIILGSILLIVIGFIAINPVERKGLGNNGE